MLSAGDGFSRGTIEFYDFQVTALVPGINHQADDPPLQ
jgi:hypothetical protein